MKKQREPRIKKRLACTLEVAGHRHSGIVLNVSPGGLFVQTRAKVEPGTEVTIELSVPGASEPLSLTAVVVRQKIVPQQLISVARGGLAFTIASAPKEYFAFLASFTPGAAPPKRAQPAEPETPKNRYRARLKQVGGSRTRSCIVLSDNEAEAREQVLAEAGEDWKILDLQSA